MLKLSVALGILAALADVAGGLVLVRARGVDTATQKMNYQQLEKLFNDSRDEKARLLGQKAGDSFDLNGKKISIEKVV